MELKCCDRLLARDDDLFCIAAEKGNFKIMELLFENVLEKHGEEKANYMINKGKGDSGKTPLMAVSSADHLEAVKVRDHFVSFNSSLISVSHFDSF